MDLTQDGTYSFDFTTNLANDDDTSNDAYEHMFIILKTSIKIVI